MKAILLSIRPKWVAKILNGEKTIEIRKNPSLYKAVQKLIKEYGRALFLIYCTKAGDLVTDNGKGKYYLPFGDVKKQIQQFRLEVNGKVVAMFWCDNADMDFVDNVYKEARIDKMKLIKYLEGKPLYAIHITELKIFNKPKELNEFAYPRKCDTKCSSCYWVDKWKDDNSTAFVKMGDDFYDIDINPECDECPWWEYHRLKRAPQSWCYVEVDR